MTVTRNQSDEDKERHGASSPDGYDQKVEISNVFSKIASSQETKEPIPEHIPTKLEAELDLNKPDKVSGNYFVVDIETYRDTEMKEDYGKYCAGNIGILKDPIKIKAKLKANADKFALSPFTGQVILVGLLDNNGQTMQYGLDGATEKVVLQDAWRTMNTLMSEGYRMVSFNGKKFDVPYLWKRAMIKGINLTPTIALNLLMHQYNNFWHYDVFNVLGGEGSLAKWNYLLGYGTEFENIANEIAGWYEEKKFDVIKQKNIADIRKTGRIYEQIRDWVIE